MKMEDYLDMLDIVQVSRGDLNTQLHFLESMVKHLPVGQQRGVRAYFADIHKATMTIQQLLEEQREWCTMFTPPQMEEAEQLQMTFGEMPTVEDV